MRAFESRDDCLDKNGAIILNHRNASTPLEMQSDILAGAKNYLLYKLFLLLVCYCDEVQFIQMSTSDDKLYCLFLLVLSSMPFRLSLSPFSQVSGFLLWSQNICVIHLIYICVVGPLMWLRLGIFSWFVLIYPFANIFNPVLINYAYIFLTYCYCGFLFGVIILLRQQVPT